MGRRWEKKLSWRTIFIAAYGSVLIWSFISQGLMPALTGGMAPPFDMGEFVKNILVQPIWIIIWVWIASKIEKEGMI